MELTSAQLAKYIKGPDFPTGGQIMNTPQEIRDIYKTGIGHHPHPRHLAGGPVDAQRQDDLHHQRALHREQVDARRAHRRRRAVAQAAASARRQGSVDRRRADCAGAEGRRRQADGDGVSLQAHAAPVELPGQPDVSGADREPARRQAGAARAAPDPLAVPALPARGRPRPAQARARGAEDAHPHPRRLRDRLRRARRDPEDRPQVRRQGRTPPRRS